MDKTMATHIGFLLIDGFALMSYAAATEPFRAANLLAGRALYRVTNLGVSGHQAQASSGAVIPCAAAPDAPLDLLLVAAGGDPWAFRGPAAMALLHRQAAHGARLGGISGGPVILARAGLMAGRRMTVHWDHAPSLSARFPDLLLERSIYVIDRDRVTCAGGTAPLDLMHALIAEQHGAAFARRVSDWFLHTDIRPSGGPQRAGLIERYGVHHPGLIAALEAMENHVADPLDMTGLAAITGIGPRHLNRLFGAHLGRSVMAVYRDIRAATARRLLTGSTLSITEIALATGFSGSAHFSRAMRDLTGHCPSALRRSSGAGPETTDAPL